MGKEKGNENMVYCFYLGIEFSGNSGRRSDSSDDELHLCRTGAKQNGHTVNARN